MDKALIRRRFSRAVSTYLQQADVQKQIACRMAQWVKEYVPADCRKRVVEVGCGTGAFTRAFLHDETPETLLLNDLCPEVEPALQDVLQAGVSFCAGDAERMVFPPAQDLFVSCSALQWFEHPEAFFVKCHCHLKEGGYWAFSTFGPQNLKEVVALTGSGLPYRSLDAWLGVLASQYEIVFSREEVVRLTFASPMEVLKHLKETGVTGVGGRRWTRTSLAEFGEEYTVRFSLPDGKVSLTYHPIYVIARKINEKKEGYSSVTTCDY